jgi:hypothetical protein
MRVLRSSGAAQEGEGNVSQPLPVARGQTSSARLISVLTDARATATAVVNRFRSAFGA